MNFKLNDIAAATLAAACLALATASGACAQEGIPLPGSGGGYVPGAVMPGPTAQEIYVPPAPARAASGGATLPRRASAYGDLPLSADDAKAKIIELRNMMGTVRPQELHERTGQLCEWIGDMIDAHNRLANALGRHDQFKAQAQAERQTAQRFAILKNQGQLLKAELLINMHRFPEALGPLVDIVIAEPTSKTGEQAYKKLRDLGFSPDTPAVGEGAPAPAKKTASVAARSK